MAFSFEWRLQPGYHETHQLFDLITGKILGSVFGSTWNDFEGWGAIVEFADSEPVRLGKYITPETAKVAIERYILSHEEQ